MNIYGEDEECHEPAMSAQQKRFTSGSGSRLANYRDLIVGDRGWPFFFGFETYNLLFANMASVLGVGARALALPFLLGAFGKKSILGRGVTIRQPHLIRVGRSTMIDDFAVLDVRSLPNQDAKGIDIGNHVLIGRNTIVTAKGGSIKLGDACNISSFCRIATRSSIEIGESVLIAAYAYIGCGNHSTGDPDKPIIEQGMVIRGGVRIGKNSWIGAKATVLDGVTIGENAVVGAHSLVREDVPDNAIVAGSPAKLLRTR